MAAFMGTMFFLAAMAIAVWSIVDSVRPRLSRILFLLEYGPATGLDMPAPSRITVRERSTPARAALPALRLAA